MITLSHLNLNSTQRKSIFRSLIFTLLSAGAGVVLAACDTGYGDYGSIIPEDAGLNSGPMLSYTIALNSTNVSLEGNLNNPDEIFWDRLYPRLNPPPAAGTLYGVQIRMPTMYEITTAIANPQHVGELVIRPVLGMPFAALGAGYTRPNNASHEMSIPIRNPVFQFSVRWPASQNEAIRRALLYHFGSDGQRHEFESRMCGLLTRLFQADNGNYLDEIPFLLEVQFYDLQRMTLMAARTIGLPPPRLSGFHCEYSATNAESVNNIMLSSGQTSITAASGLTLSFGL